MSNTAIEKVEAEEWESMTTEDRMEAVLAHAFRGIHHVRNIHKESASWWWVSVWDGLSTYDFDQLTRLVLAAHRYCVRVEIGASAPRRIKITLHTRNGRTGFMSHRHPAIYEVTKSQPLPDAPNENRGDCL